MQQQKHKRLSWYWQCQLIGWSVAAIYWELDAFRVTPYFRLDLALFHFVADVAVNILLTHAYRHYARQHQWDTLLPAALVKRLIPAICLLALAFMLTVNIRFYLVGLYFRPDDTGSFVAYLWQHAWIPFIAGLRMMAIWVLAYHLYQYSRREIRMARENARLTIIAREAQLSRLEAQLNPHFFFNSLNNIKSLIAENPSSARRAIDLLSDLLRSALYETSDKLVPVSQEISLVKDYLELEKLRFENRLHYQWQIADTVLPCLIPPMSIHILVENAIKHGIAKRKEGGAIMISMEKTVACITIRVQQPGTLTPDKNNTGLGIRNLSERLQLQYNGLATFSLEALPEETVLATILIPAI
ncbi:sensor histidine kinase [Chitinophaga nivalis]|uniref:Histidine kinase n=1 Tax=Chitinophaga nivalis TaxID=2991709 RepID=A0ABT3ILE7_9BACT|nr:histidine kinase [Chitinophaga nivalis]MCW3465740.1 histidine kinase [Chitinophaga nivalis]MCW3484569.1 histidine kinase [Chitinophaga nivalis]